MLHGSVAHTDNSLIGNVENNNPVLISGGDGLSKTRLKKGSRKPPRPIANSRLQDLNNNRTAVQSGLEPQNQSFHSLQLRPATKKELKSKGGKHERGAAQTGTQQNRNLPRHDTHNHSSVRLHKPRPASALSPSSKTTPHKPQPKKPLVPLPSSRNLQNPRNPPQDDPEKVYAGAKFSEPPSPSVLPKPPSHWVGEDRPPTSNQTPETQTRGDQTPETQTRGDQTRGDQTPENQNRGDQTPENQTRGNQSRGNQTPKNQTPENQTRGDQTPENQTRGDQTPETQTRGDQTPENQTRGNQTPENQNRGDQTPENQTRGNQSRGNQTPKNQTRGNQTRGDQTPENQTRGNQTRGNQSREQMSVHLKTLLKVQGGS